MHQIEHVYFDNMIEKLLHDTVLLDLLATALQHIKIPANIFSGT